MKKRKSIWDSTIAGFGIGVTLKRKLKEGERDEE